MNIPAINWLTNRQIREQAEQILKTHHSIRSLPIPVDTIVDAKLGFDIVPLPELEKHFNWDAFLAIGSNEIYMDAFIYENSNYETRFRFTLAHELGHAVIHREVFEAVNICSLDDYKDFDTSLKQWQKHRMDSEANEFAAYLLVPDDSLAASWAVIEPALREDAEEAQKRGFT